jgi:CelD/BcsL family acetyltransferase involved in cellulose biosynthesis
LWVLEARRGSSLAGLAPLFIYGTGANRIVAPLGAGVSDYLDILIDPDEPGALEAFIAFLHQHASEWTELDFPDLRESSPLLCHQFLRAFRLEQFESSEPQMYELCPQLILPVTIDELRTVVPAKQLRNLRVARRQLPEAQVELATEGTLNDFLGALFRLHQKRWQSSREPGVLVDPQVRGLHARAGWRLLHQGNLRLFGLRLCGQLLACLMAFADRDTLRLYLQGYDPEWARFSPGAQLVGAALEQAIREGKRTVDFMRGKETYKHYWGARDVPTFRLHISKRLRRETTIAEKSVA